MRKFEISDRFTTADIGLEIEGDQQTKTRGALSFFTTGEGFE